ncbi:MAG TPA: MaoC family dehydratase [Baekduia sp.]|uniref:MaoC family dehydratase n=1 Tax=Baekduia sp. TaxID=2600305 RepID=UPI002D77FDC8|nr:MaoC family dehydratase [Baekduia sp.]HET6506999.1 MaoC family dehydratase [Baekduia sp.]
MTPEAGAALGPWVVESVSPAAMADFAEVLADPNPIHLDPEAVKAMGLGDRVVNQGPANFGYVLEMLKAAVPGATVVDLRVRLQANVFGGDRVIAAGVVESVADGEHGTRILNCAVWLDVDGGARAIAGTASLILSQNP